MCTSTVIYWCKSNCKRMSHQINISYHTSSKVFDMFSRSRIYTPRRCMTISFYISNFISNHLRNNLLPLNVDVVFVYGSYSWHTLIFTFRDHIGSRLSKCRFKSVFTTTTFRLIKRSLYKFTVKYDCHVFL